MGNEVPGLIQSLMGGGTTPLVSDSEQREMDRKKVKLLFKRISTAKKIKEAWERNYEVDRSHDYVRGFQRPDDDERDAQGERRYQINKILSAMKAKIPKIFYYHPYVRIRPSLGREDVPMNTVTDRATLLQDTINTIIKQQETRFKPECLLALKEAHWAFGIVEVGYEADWTENPYARKPELVENEDVQRELENVGLVPPEPDENDPIAMALAQEPELPSHETFYVKHIPARQFFVSTNDRCDTYAMDWVGYWEWMYVTDIKKSDAFQNTEDLKPTARASSGGSGTDKELTPHYGSDEDVPPDMVRVWRLWDLRERVRYVLAEGHDRVLKRTDFDWLPLFDLRLEVMPGEWYPIPPVFQQLCEQDEFNDGREFLRMVRKGTRPRFMFDKHAFTPDELEKLENDDFGVFVGVENNNLQAIAPIQQPTFSEAALRTLTLSEAGFAEQAASSPTARLTRGSGGAPTATEVEQLSQMGDIRDSYEQQEVADWLSEVAGGLLSCAVDKMTLPQWVAINSDPHSPALAMDAMRIAQIVQQIKNPIPESVAQAIQLLQSGMAQPLQEVTPQSLQEAYDHGRWDITIDIESMSPVSESQHAARIMQALNMLSSPGVGRLLSLSPQLLKTMLNMMGIRNSADHQAIQQALVLRDQIEQMMAMMGGPGPKGVAPMAGGGQPNTGAGRGPQGAPPEPPKEG